jgi:hypothetical protein
MTRTSPRCDWLALWILWSAWCAVSGWILSALGQLDRTGYAVCVVIFLAGLALKRRFWASPETRPLFLTRRSTYARLLPKGWLLLALLALVGGLLYHPDNYDYLTYRFPRLLHWSWEQRWHWIGMFDDRQDTSSVGMEWLMAPLFALFRTDRLFFLNNFVSFLFMPGLIFSVFRHLGIGGRVSWWWMWILPTGFCFLLQAASMGNDGFAAVYLLAALHYAFRANERSPQTLVLSLLSIALVTGAKASNIPLVVPWLAVLWLQRGPVLASVRPILLLGACVVAAVCSFLPIALANIHYTGSYTGDPTNHRHLQVYSPLAGIAGNTIEIASGNFSPPLWPHDIHWPLQGEITTAMRHDYPRFEFYTVPFAIEEVTGVGLGVTVFTVVGMLYGAANRQRRFGTTALLIAGATLIAWLGYMAKMGSEAAPRLVAAYYIVGILSLVLLLPPDGRVIHRRVWRTIGYATMAVALLLLVINPSRPLLPVRWIACGLRLLHVPAAAVAKLESNYQLRATRRDGLDALCRAIPATEKIIGCISGEDDPEVSLWLPFGSRQVVEIDPTQADLTASPIRFVVVNGPTLQSRYHLTIDELLKKWPATVVGKEDRVFKTAHQSETWYLLRASTP